MERRMTGPCPKTETSRTTWAVLIGGWFVTYFVSRAIVSEKGMFGLALSPDTSPWIKAGIALLPLIPAVLVVLAFIRDIRLSDEFERRLHLEALAFAFPVTVLLLMTLGMLQLAIDLNVNDWSYRHIWPPITMFWIFGYLQARRRYGVK